MTSRARIELDPARSSGRLLYVDDVPCSYVDLDDPTHLEFGYIQRFADAIDGHFAENRPLRATHIGGGALTLPRYLQATRRRSSNIVYEIDGELITLARQELGLRTGPGLQVKIGDGRERLFRRSCGSADVIITDAFFGRVVPSQLSELSFVRQVRHVLADGGLYLLNVISQADLSVARRHAATLREVFTSVAAVADPDVFAGRCDGNVVYLASMGSLPLSHLARAAWTGPLPEKVLTPPEVAKLAGNARPIGS